MMSQMLTLLLVVLVSGCKPAGPARVGDGAGREAVEPGEDLAEAGVPGGVDEDDGIGRDGHAMAGMEV